MKVQQGNADSLILKSGGVFNLVFGFLFAGFASIFLVISFATGGSEMIRENMVFIILPLVFMVVGLGISFSAKRKEVELRRLGQSTKTTTRILTRSKKEEPFDANNANFVGLHTRLVTTNSKNGTSRKRVSSVYLMMRNGEELVIGTGSRGGVGGKQPLLEEAEHIAQFLNLPLERSGHGSGGELGLMDKFLGRDSNARPHPGRNSNPTAGGTHVFNDSNENTSQSNHNDWSQYIDKDKQ